MYAVIDTETTGLLDFSKPAEAEGQPRLASFAMILCDPELNVQAEHHWLIKPDGWTMGAEAGSINGLTMERLNAEGVPIATVLDAYVAAILAGRVVVAFNVQFDAKMMRAELRRAGRDDLFERTRNICTMRAATSVCKIAKGTGWKTPKLAEAYAHFYKSAPPDAHTALGDARTCLAVARALKRIGCLPEPQVYRAKEGTRAGEALKARGMQPELAVEEIPPPKSQAPF